MESLVLQKKKYLHTNSTSMPFYPMESILSRAWRLLGKSEAKRKTDLMWDFGRNKHFGFPGNPYDRSPHLAIRSGKWKLLVNGDGSDAQLYDMEKDKFEKNNIANEHPDLVAKLSKKVCKWYEENKDKGKE